MVDAAAAPVLAVLTRAPSSGGKTRLFASLGLPPDPALLTALLLDTLDGAAVPGVRRIVAVTPASACDEVRAIVGGAIGRGVRAAGGGPVGNAGHDIVVIAQVDGDLGARMRATIAALFAQGATMVALVGSDLPHLAAGTIATAFAILSTDPDALVLGPAADGGYYLIAARRVPDVFVGIEWGSPRVLAQTERAAIAQRFRVQRLATLDDVDSADGLRAAARSGRAPRTAAWVSARAADLTR